jgi:UPF0755 protein
VRRFLFFILFLAVMAGLGTAWWLHRPLTLKTTPLDLSIEPGTSARGVASAVAAAGVDISPWMLAALFRVTSSERLIKAGSYELEASTTPLSLLRKLVRGEESLLALTLVEGWNIRQVREALRKADLLRPDTAELSELALMDKLGRPGVHPEGRFFPDTYTYAKGSSDLALLQRAMRAMDRQLAAAWSQRAPGLAVKGPDDALILASIVEKETGRSSDRATIAAVFNNRLRIGMMLQTDPTVIYGLGERFDGNLRRVDLLTDTPWNTYTRAGLPPTPIAMPGKAALLAAVQPASSAALYFVARGDGSSQFSQTLEEHNRAVNKYQRGK